MLWKVLAVFAFLHGCAAGETRSMPTSGLDDERQIRALYAAWRDAVESSSIDGYLSVLHADVRLLPPGAAAIQGRENYRAFLQPVFATATYSIEIDRDQDVEVVGDTAVAEYEYTIELNLKDPDVGIDQPGALTAQRTSARYFDVLLKDSNGAWKVWRHSWQAK